MEQLVIAKDRVAYGWGKKRLRITGRRAYDLVLKHREPPVDDRPVVNSCARIVEVDGFEYLQLDVDNVDLFTWMVNGVKVEGITGNCLPIYYGYSQLEIIVVAENESYTMMLTGKADGCGDFNYNVHSGLICGQSIVCGNKLVSDVALPPRSEWGSK